MAIYAATVAHAAGDTGGSNSGQDLFELTAPSNSRVRVREVRIGQFSDAGDAAAELLSVRVIRFRGIEADTGTMGSAGGTVTPGNIHGWSGAPSASSTVRKNNTVLAQDTGDGVSGVVAETLVADSMNIAAGWWYTPPEEEMIIVEKNDRIVVRLSNASDALSMNGTMLFEEIGQADRK